MSEWKIRNRDGEVVFESDDPQAIVDEADRLEREAKDEEPLIGVAAGPYSIEGDPVELGVAWETDPRTGEVLRGPGPNKARKPKRRR